MTSHAVRHEDHTRNAIPADSEKFARMLERSSLGSPASRSARLLGAEIAAEFSTAGASWVHEAPRWPDVAEAHGRAAELFEAEGQPDVSELWLRAALFRSVDGPLARRLGVLLEKRRRSDDACRWYLRAMRYGDVAATGRLAAMAVLAGATDVASLFVSTGRSKLTLTDARRAEELAHRLDKAGKPRGDTLVDRCRDDDLLFWTGCGALAAGRRTAALTCFTTAAARGHDVAALTLHDMTARSGGPRRALQ